MDETTREEIDYLEQTPIASELCKEAAPFTKTRLLLKSSPHQIHEFLISVTIHPDETHTNALKPHILKSDNCHFMDIRVY